MGVTRRRSWLRLAAFVVAYLSPFLIGAIQRWYWSL